MQMGSHVCYLLTGQGNGDVSSYGTGHETGRMGGDWGESRKRMYSKPNTEGVINYMNWADR